MPDPAVTAELERTQTELENMRKQLVAMEMERSDMSEQRAQLQSQLFAAKNEVAQLETHERTASPTGAALVGHFSRFMSHPYIGTVRYV